MRWRWHLHQIGRAASRLLNALTGGEGDTTFSAYSWELLRRGDQYGLARVGFVDWINREPGHCYRAWVWHQEHRLFQPDDEQPLPEHRIMPILFAFMLAVVYRFRGGGFIATGRTQFVRLVYAATVAAILLIFGTAAPWMNDMLAGLLAGLGLIVFGHSDHQDMGRMPPGYSADGEVGENLTRWLPPSIGPWAPVIDFAGMCVIGLARHALIVLPLAPFLAWHQIIAFVALGVTHGVAYLIAYNIGEETADNGNWWHDTWNLYHKRAEALYGFMLLWCLTVLWTG